MDLIDNRDNKQSSSKSDKEENLMEEWLDEFYDERRVRLRRIRIEDDRVIDENMNTIMRDPITREEFIEKMLDHWIRQEVRDNPGFKEVVENFNLDGKKLFKEHGYIRCRKSVRDILREYKKS